ncbi:MAG: ABC transporter substrate binding protein, partial [Thermoanaerobaculia bacterium]|nr:ABC transporter substrate binding protein [Thermoanaerobaculia bacterium]
MWPTARRLLLGIALIASASAVLLLSDRGTGRSRRAQEQVRVAILQHASQPIIDEGVRGMILGLAEAGYVEGRNLEIRRYNAENDVATANTIAAEITAADFDLLLTATTVSLQAVANANQGRQRRHVFALVTDPAAAGVGVGADDPLDHPPYMTGYGTMQPVAEAIAIATSMLPGLEVVGIPWNAGEVNSEIATGLAKAAAAARGVEVLEAPVENTAAVGEAVASLVARGAQAIWSPGDVTVLTALDTAVAQARTARVPVFTNIPGSTDQGSLFDVGADYLEVGRRAGRLAARVLAGVDPATIPVENVVPERITINEAALQGLRDPWRFPDAVVSRARAAEEARAALRRPDRQVRIDLLEYVEVQDTEDAERGIRDGFRDAGWVEGRDFVLRKRIAQGDMPTLPALVDAAVTERTDLIMTLSTPTLQAALSRGGDTPIVFTFCASGVAAGAGASDEDHLPNVTGVPTESPYPELVALAREALPSLRRIGTLVV